MSTIFEPVSPQACTVLGSRVKATSPAWTGLDFERAVVRDKATIMIWAVGPDEAPYDPHLDVPWMHPDDRATMAHDPECWCVYRVRPRRKRGFVRFERTSDGWVIVRKPARREDPR